MTSPRFLRLALTRIVLWPVIWLAIVWYRLGGMSAEAARLEVSSWLTTALAIERARRGPAPVRHLLNPLFYLILCALAENASPAPNSFPVQGSQSTADWLDAYARAAGLQPLTGTEGPILRVWVQDVMTGDSWGYVVTSKSTLVCRTSYINRTTSFSVKRASCRTNHTSNHQVRALDLLVDLAQLNGAELECGVVDGAEVFVEGTASGRRFSLAAGNPDFCQDAGSMLVTKALQILEGKS